MKNLKKFVKKKISFLLNDNVHLSKKLGYDGVHLGQNDMDCKNAREILGKNFSIGISCNNSIELAKKAKNRRCRLCCIWSCI